MVATSNYCIHGRGADAEVKSNIYFFGHKFFFEGLYFQENFILKTSILKTRTIKSLKEEEIRTQEINLSIHFGYRFSS